MHRSETVFLVFILIISCFSTSFGQQRANPFEIEERLDSIAGPVSAPVTGDRENNVTNVFELNREDDRPVNNSGILTSGERRNATDLLTSDTISGTADGNPVDGIETSNNINTSRILSDDVNPFDVDHVPIRKSKLREDAGVTNPNNAKLSAETKKASSNSFLFWMILLSALILAVIINTRKGVISGIFRSMANENMLNQMQRREANGRSGPFILLYAVYFINAATFAYLTLKFYGEMSGFRIWFFCLTGLTVLYLIRHIGMYFFGNFFPVSRESAAFNFTIICFNLFLGIVLIPLNLLLAFGPDVLIKPMLIISMFFILLVFLIRSVRGIFISSQFIQKNFFHFFLYLCTFELAPIFLLIKLAENSWGSL